MFLFQLYCVPFVFALSILKLKLAMFIQLIGTNLSRSKFKMCDSYITSYMVTSLFL